MLTKDQSLIMRSNRIRLGLPASKQLAQSVPSRNASSFHARKLIDSTMVGCTISLPGKTPHVTALGPSDGVLVARLPALVTA
ncbi:hypothetical protein FJTKL_03048 [Diaporthe vaccinii]|uniref:Uncharacterized protein n=1 Tax=Diaporthe vaccinii TaxID=105482 RepID=A0ABR4DW81_9PEZI